MADGLTPLLRAALAAIPETGEVTREALLEAVQLRMDEVIPALARFVASGHVVAWQEKRDGELVRLYRRTAPGEVSQRRVAYNERPPTAGRLAWRQ